MSDLALITIPRSDLQPLLEWVDEGLEHYLTTLGGDADQDTHWKERSSNTSNWPPKEGNLAQCINQFTLLPYEAFLLILTGRIEAEPHITFKIAELQQPEESGGLTLHLALDILNTLFAPKTPFNTLDISHSSLLLQHLLSLEGEGPLPLHFVRIHPVFWSVLCERSTTWPDCRVIDKGDRSLLPRSMRQRLPQLSQFLLQGEVQTLVLRGHPNSGRQILAKEIATLLSMLPLLVPLELWQEHPALRHCCRYGGWLPIIHTQLNAGEPLELKQADPPHPLTIIVNMDGAIMAPSCLEQLIPLPDQQQRKTIWQETIADKHLSDKLSGAVLLSGPTIVQIGQAAQKYALSENTQISQRHIRLARLQFGAEKLRLLAQPVLQHVPKEAVVFPPLIDNHLEDIVARARRRESLWQGLGETMQASPNSGLRALFVGESGTGKTIAASYLANRLGAPLYRVDLGAVMNKYIGESEKNLGLLLDQAAAADLILLFDEADSLFGSRTDAKQTGERYANNLTNYLLSRIENHPGIVLLTTNNRERIDNAFHRRIEVIIEFPLPGFQERKRLWHSHLGRRAPGEELIATIASHCDLTGGQIRNAVLTAAGTEPVNQPISPQRLIQAIGREYQKLGRSMPAPLDNFGR